MKNYLSAMILAAGFGKRMMPLTRDLPKPLLQINGITLLDNSINILKNLGCNNIVINTHYMYEKIYDHINRRKDNLNIDLIYESGILDTGGAIKNALNLFKNKDLMIINSDIFWTYENIIDFKNLIAEYKINKNPHLLLVNKNNANGLNKKNGDFILDKNKVKRFKQNDPIFFYSGLQILSSDVLQNYPNKKFSINDVWDNLIENEILFGNTMKTDWFHVGDIQGLAIAKELNS